MSTATGSERNRDVSIVKTPAVELRILEDLASDEEGEDVEEHVGRFVWPAAVPMLRHITMSSSFDIKKYRLVVELGAGCGVLGMGMAAAAEDLHIILTDHDDDWLQQNVTLNETLLREASSATLEVARLDWRNPDDIATVRTKVRERLSANSDHNDELLIVASDVLYNHGIHKYFASTLYELCKEPQSTRMIIGFPDRDHDEEHFRPFATELFGDTFASSKPIIDDNRQKRKGGKMDLRVIDFCVNKKLPVPISGRSFTTHMPSSLHQLHILGSGSIGLFLAASICSRHPAGRLTLLLRDQHAPNLLRRAGGGDGVGIDVSIHQLNSKDDDRKRCNIHVPATLVSDLGNENSEPIRTLVLTTKAFQAADALRSVRRYLVPDARVVVFCNGGLAVREELERTFLTSSPSGHRWSIELASITHGVYRRSSSTDSCDPSAYTIVHAGKGKIFLTPPVNGLNMYDALSPLMLDEAGLNCTVVPPQEMEDILWYKLATNCVCNPITAIHGCVNGEMSERVPNLDSTIEQIVDEVCSVRELHSSGQLKAKTQMVQFIHQVIQDNANNRSSMEQDVSNERPTEINYLNGWIVRAGAEHGLDCPVNHELQSRILELQDRYNANTTANSE